MFMAYPFDYGPEVATILAQLCCHNNQLPQGAPTSPIVSNFICRQLDSEISSLARRERCHYTRYADDICISTDRSSFPASLAVPLGGGAAEIGQPLIDVIISNGFRPNSEKTRLMRHTQRQRVTGLIVNDYANVSSSYLRDLRNLLYIWRRYGEADAAEAYARFRGVVNRPPFRAAASFKFSIRGRVQHVGSVKGWSSESYRRLGHSLQDLDPSFRPRTLLQLHAPQAVRVYTEGESDVMHLRAALDYFNARGEFTNLLFEFPDDAPMGGEGALFEKCKALAQTPQDPPCLFVFDRDNDAMLRKAVGPSDYRDHGNGVAAVAIASPSWRGDSVTIEMLYQDADLSRHDPVGRRLYLESEFDRRTGHHDLERVHMANPVKRTLVREDVFSLEDGTPVGLSKVAFGELLLAREGEFADPIDGGASSTEWRSFARTARLAIEGSSSRASGRSKSEGSLMCTVWHFPAVELNLAATPAFQSARLPTADPTRAADAWLVVTDGAVERVDVCARGGYREHHGDADHLEVLPESPAIVPRPGRRVLSTGPR
jgi:RNA-directed DNA polymerase